MPKQKTEQRVRVVCDLDEHEDVWIEYDVSGWGIDILAGTAFKSLAWIVANFIPEHSIAWHVVGDDGAVVAHPGKGRTDVLWNSVWQQVGPRTGRALFRWFALSALNAVGQTMDLPFKSEAPDDGAGAKSAGTEEESADGVANRAAG